MTNMKLCMGCMNQIEDRLSTCPYCGFDETTLRQESYYLDPGTIVGGKYIVGRVINYSGHTISYLGMDAEVNRKVIVKEYLPSDFSTRSEGEKDITIYSGDAQEQFEQGLTNFLNEANRIQHLQDAEGIAKIYDCIAENDTGYVISEYLEGQTLKEILDSGKKYSAKEAKEFVEKILRGLRKVHPLDIVHCDISPETILVTNSGEIKLLDFGATRYVTTANSKSLAIILKQGYAPEEQYRSRGVRGSWTDVYALGAVMYRMITGVVPQESVERALVDELKEPSKLGVSIPENMENALMNALNVYQNDRTSSADVFLKELNSPTVKRVKVKKKRNETGKFPVWAKGLVACLLCTVVVGGAILFKMSGDDVGNLDSTSIALKDLRGMSVNDAAKYIESLNSENGWDIALETDNYVFDLSADNNTIYNQSIEASTDLSNEKSLKNIEGLSVDDMGKVTGTITCTIYSNDKLHYSEISGMNAYALATKLGFDTSDTSRFKKVDKDNTNYYDLASIQTKDGVISVEELKKQANEEKEITYRDIQSISYYASDFFYWKSLPDFTDRNLDTLNAYATYELKNETTRKKTGYKKVLKGTSLVDDSFYTFSEKYKKGDIFKQTKAAGERLDTSEGMEDALLYAVGQRIAYVGESGKQVKAKLSWSGVTVKFAGSGKESDKVVEVSVKDAEGRTVDCFKKGQILTVTITTKKETAAIPTPAPKVKKTPMPSVSSPARNNDNRGFDDANNGN